MKAVVYKEYGSPHVLRLEEVEKPVPRKDEILIKVHAAEATKADCELRSFRFAVKWFWLPLRIALGITKPRRQILGGYFSGEVAVIGEDVEKFRAGDPVFGSAGLRLGAYGEYMCLPASYTIVPRPDDMTFEEAASVPLGGLNALHFLKKAAIQPGETVLVNGAGGSIGTFGVQIAKTMGAEVTAVDGPHKANMLGRIGASHFIDYTREDFTKTGQAWDVILDMVARSSYTGCINALKPGGRYLMANPRISDMLRSVFTTRLTDKSAFFAFAGETEEELRLLREMIEAGEIKATIDRIYPMEQAAEAHRRVESEKRLGCVVISIQSV